MTRTGAVDAGKLKALRASEKRVSAESKDEPVESRLEAVGEQRVVAIGFQRTDVAARAARARVASLVGRQALRRAGAVDREAARGGKVRRCRAAVNMGVIR